MSATTARQIVLDAVEGAGYPAPFREVVLLALAQPGRILNDDRPSRFQDVISTCCMAAHGRPDLANRVIAAFELCITSSDILDEIEDGDESPVISHAGVARALNASTSLLALGYATLCAPTGNQRDDSTLLSSTHTLSTAIVQSTIGQDDDLSSGGTDASSTQQALEIARRKSGSLIAGACVMGASLGSVTPEALDLYYRFGLHLGTAYQLNNDLHDASSDRKTDLALARSTVPLAYYRSPETVEAPVARETLLRSGALHFTWVLLETERNRCDHIISQLSALGQDASILTPLLGNR